MVVQREDGGATRTVVQPGKGSATRGEWCNEGRVQREESDATKEGGGNRTTVATD